MKLALAQIECSWGDRDSNIEKIAAFAREAAGAHADAVLFPELSASGMYKNEKAREVAEELDGKSSSSVGRLCRQLRIAIGFGVIERAKPLPFNTYCIIDSTGNALVRYRKINIPKLERPYFQGGMGKPVFDLLGMRSAVATCWDTTNDGLLGEYAARNVELLIAPHAWDADPVDERGTVIDVDTMEELYATAQSGGIARWLTHDEMRDYFYSYVPAFSRRHRLTTCFVNQTGQPHPDVKFVGPSFAVDEGGSILTATPDESERLVYVSLDR